MELMMSIDDYNHHHSGCIGRLLIDIEFSSGLGVQPKFSPKDGSSVFSYASMYAEGKKVFVEGSFMTDGGWWNIVIPVDNIVRFDFSWPQLGFIENPINGLIYRLARAPNRRSYHIGYTIRNLISDPPLMSIIDPCIPHLADQLDYKQRKAPSGQVAIPIWLMPMMQGIPLDATYPSIVWDLFTGQNVDICAAYRALVNNDRKPGAVINRDFCWHKLVWTGDRAHLVYRTSIIGFVDAHKTNKLELLEGMEFMEGVIWRELGWDLSRKVA